MQLMIEISEDFYNGVKVVGEESEDITEEVVTLPMECIANGIVIPKGHGDLIDKNEAEKIADKMFEHITSPLLDHIQTYDVYNILRLTPTVIEADKTESKEEEFDNLESMLEDLWRAEVRNRQSATCNAPTITEADKTEVLNNLDSMLEALKWITKEWNDDTESEVK